MSQSIFDVFKKKFPKKNPVSEVWLLLLVAMPLKAEINYQFPGDSMNRQALSHQRQAIYDTSRYSGSEFYRDNHSNPALNDRPLNMIHKSVENSSYRFITDVKPYPVAKLSNHYDNHLYEYSMRIKPEPTPEGMSGQYKGMYPNLIYASDLEPDRRLIKQKNIAMLHKTNHQNRYPKVRGPNPYMPISMHSMPGMLPLNSSGAFNQGYTITGYERLKSDYNGFKNISGNRYNSLSDFGIFQDNETFID